MYFRSTVHLSVEASTSNIDGANTTNSDEGNEKRQEIAEKRKMDNVKNCDGKHAEKVFEQISAAW